MLYYENIIEFIGAIVSKACPEDGFLSTWPLSVEQWEVLSEERQTMIRIQLDEALCKLGRHDYEYVEETETGYNLKCFYCGAVKHTSGGRK
jgi:hypothetical protein